MIQFNLLPDVKLQYIKADYRKRLAITISIIVSAFFLILLILLLLFVKVGQTKHMNSLTKDIEATTAELQKTQDLNKILTIQNQLESLPGLHNDKVISSRLFDYLNQLTPEKATISDVTLDFADSTLIIKGNADSLSTVNKFADTLKFTDFKVDGSNPKEGKAFSNVVLNSFSVSSTSTAGSKEKQIAYEIKFNFDPAIFSNALNAEGKPANVSLTVPSIISTRSETEKPGSIFDAQPEEIEEGASQ